MIWGTKAARAALVPSADRQPGGECAAAAISYKRQIAISREPSLSWTPTAGRGCKPVSGLVWGDGGWASYAGRVCAVLCKRGRWRRRGIAGHMHCCHNLEVYVEARWQDPAPGAISRAAASMVQYGDCNGTIPVIKHTIDESVSAVSYTLRYTPLPRPPTPTPGFHCPSCEPAVDDPSPDSPTEAVPGRA